LSKEEISSHSSSGDAMVNIIDGEAATTIVEDQQIKM
jgi:hypothetical protein